MPQRFESRRYDPEIIKLMKTALESAWEMVRIPPKSAELARLVLASAIIDAVDAGVRECEQLAGRALAALAAAARVSNEKLELKSEPGAIPLEDPRTSTDV
jgi:hypothetical protein